MKLSGILKINLHKVFVYNKNNLLWKVQVAKYELFRHCELLEVMQRFMAYLIMDAMMREAGI